MGTTQPPKTKCMSNMTNTKQVTVYQIEASDLEQLIIRAVVDAMKRHYTPSNTPAADSPEMITRDEAAKFLHVSKQTLFNWERLNYLVPVRVGRRVLYPAELLRQFANSNNK